MSALPYILCTKPVFTLTNYILTKGMFTFRGQNNNTTETEGILYCMMWRQTQIRHIRQVIRAIKLPQGT
jgi:hypothetical protein